MKKILLLITLFWSITHLFAQTVVNVDNIRYIIEDGKALIGRQDKELAGDIVIPDKITHDGINYVVSGFVSPTNITAWSSNTVTCEGGAFQSCQISSIVIPNTITVVSAGAFNFCSQLKEVKLPETITMLGAASFAGCTNLTEISLPDSIKDLGSYTPYGYQSYVFGGCNNLKKINIPSSVTRLAEGCFMGCGLDSIYIPETIISLSESSLAANNLRIVKMGIRDLKKLSYSQNCFASVSSANLYVPKGSLSVYQEYEPWSNFKSLREYGESSGEPFVPDQINVVIDGLKYILKEGKATVGRQTRLLRGDIIVPDAVQYEAVIYPVTEIIGPKGLTCYSGGSIVCVGGAFQSCPITSIKLPKTITVIPAGAFQNCNELISVQLPEAITMLGSASFAGCIKLPEINLPQTVKDLASYSEYGYRSYTFGNCVNLKKINIPSQVTQLASGCFMGAGLEEVLIHENLLTLSEQCLKTNSLKTIKICVKDMEKLKYSNSSFGDVSNTDLIVPKGSKQVYQEYYPWMDFKSISEYDDGSVPFVPNKVTVRIDGVRYILENGKATVGRQNEDLSGDIEIPSSITYEGDAFPVKDIVSPTEIIAWSSNSVTCENGAFQSCPIISVKLPNSITVVPAGAFNSCRELVSVELPEYATMLGAACFAGCSNLKELYIPETVKDLGSYTQYGYRSFTFGNCSNLKKINIPDGISSLVEGCFMQSGLETFLIPKSITKVEEDCFSVSTLKNIKICHTDFKNLSYTESSFANVSNVDLFVPVGCKDFYKEFYPWKNFKSISEYSDENDSIQYNAYRVSYVLPENLMNNINRSYMPLKAKADSKTTFAIYKNAYNPSGVQIPSIEIPQIDGAIFKEWENLPEKMPSFDIEIKAIFELPSKIIDNSSNNIIVSPNPSTDYISISGINSGSLKITDLNGRLVLTKNFINPNRIDIRDMSPGVYLLRIETTDGTIIGKLIKK